MPSGKKSKQMRRAASAPPPVQSKGGPRRVRQANPKVLAIVGGLAAVAAVVIVLAVTLGGGSGNKSLSSYPTLGSLSGSLPGSTEANAMFKGIPQHGLTLGSPTAPVTMVEYIDLQCPFCKDFETLVMPDIITKYVKTGKVKIEVRVLKFLGDGQSPNDSLRARNVMIAAAAQNKGFNFSEVLYYNQGTENTGWLSDDMLAQIASSVPGLRVHDVLNQRNSSSVNQQGAAFDAQMAADKISGTPTLFAGKSGTKGKQIPLTSPTDSQAVVTALDAALAS
jgi:protein-disulfide isomerase